jgi:hypothetical protein
MKHTILKQRSTEYAKKIKKNDVGAYILEVPMIQTDIFNNNDRMYPSKLVDPVVENYIETFVKTKRAVGHLHHPEVKDLNALDYSKVAIKITSLKKQDKDWIGQFSPIIGIPYGDLVQALVDNDVQFATSARASGFCNKKTKIVERFRLITPADVEYAPGAPDAFAHVLTECLNPAAIENDRTYEDIIKLVKDNNINLAFQLTVNSLRDYYSI